MPCELTVKAHKWIDILGERSNQMVCHDRHYRFENTCYSTISILQIQNEAKVRLTSFTLNAAVPFCPASGSADGINHLDKYPAASQKSCFLGHERNLLADEGLMRGGSESASIVVLTVSTWRAKQRSKLIVKPCRDLNLKGFHLNPCRPKRIFVFPQRAFYRFCLHLAR